MRLSMSPSCIQTCVVEGWRPVTIQIQGNLISILIGAMKQTHSYRILPYNYNRYSSFYQERESFYKSFINQYYLDFAHQMLSAKHYNPFHTNTLIAPHDIGFGASPRKVIWKLGMPSFQIKDINDFKDHKILFYRTKLLRQKVLIQFHFINSFFYYSQLSFLSFTEKTNSILYDSLKSKYQCSASSFEE